MDHERCSKEECKHQNIKFCKKCNVLYCVDCGKEWVEKIELYTSPYYFYSYTWPDYRTSDPLSPNGTIICTSSCSYEK